jgi:hypothetical protein
MILKRRDFLKLSATGLVLTACAPKIFSDQHSTLKSQQQNEDLEEFVSLWLALGGVPAFEAATYPLAYRHFNACHPGELNDVLAVWSKRPENPSDHWIQQNLWSDPGLRSTCKDLVLSIWFGIPFVAGKPTDISPTSVPGNIDDERVQLWESASFLNMVKTHATGYPNVEYGDWAKKPVEG